MREAFALFTSLLGMHALAAAGTPVFYPNPGDAPASIKYRARVGQVVADFADNGMAVGPPNSPLRVAFAGAAPRSNVSLHGNTLRYQSTWPGIEIEYAPYQQKLKSEYHVQPGADPRLIRLRYDGGVLPRLQADGSILVASPGATFVESAPYAYQDLRERVRVEAVYKILNDGTVGFELGPYDHSRPLVIDPVMSYSTLFGGSGNTAVTAVALDTFGDTIVAGWTDAYDLPAHGARTKSGGGVDAFVAKLSGEGKQVVWCTYLGGSGDDRAFGVAVDPANNVYVTGWTSSTNFPITGGFQARLSGGRDAFVTKLNSSGTTILYSTYLGGNNYDQGNAITVDASGAAYVAGDTMSTNFPLVSAYQTAPGGGQDIFVAKLNPNGNGLVFSTYLGGNAADHGAAIALDSLHNVYVAGSTYSANFPVVNASQPRIGGGQDAVAAELGATGNSLLFSTFIGGSGGTPGLGESANGVAVDVSGNLYVAGSTSSIDFPTTAGAYQRTLTNGGHEDHGFAWKINSARTQILYSTYIAGMNLDTVNGMAVDPAGNAYLVGSTSSPDFPGVRAFQPAITGLTNAFLLKLNAAGSGLIFGSFLGGSSSDAANAVAVDGRQNVVIGGIAHSSDFPLVNAAQAYSNGPYCGFVTRVASGWYPISYQNGWWNMDVWHDSGYDGASSTLTYAGFGQAGDVPIVGDWTGSGSTKIGVFRNGLWILDTNGNGVIDGGDRQFTWCGTGQYSTCMAGDVPLVGDWDGTGYLKAGIWRHGVFIFDLSGHMSGKATGKQDFFTYFGWSNGIPVVGDWGNTGQTKIATFCVFGGIGTWAMDMNGDFKWGSGDTYLYYGTTGDIPIIGDWDGSGTSKIGVIRGGQWILNTSGSNTYQPGIDTQFYFGNSSYQFLVGH